MESFHLSEDDCILFEAKDLIKFDPRHPKNNISHLAFPHQGVTESFDKAKVLRLSNFKHEIQHWRNLSNKQHGETVIVYNHQMPLRTSIEELDSKSENLEFLAGQSSCIQSTAHFKQPIIAAGHFRDSESHVVSNSNY